MKPSKIKNVALKRMFVYNGEKGMQNSLFCKNEGAPPCPICGEKSFPKWSDVVYFGKIAYAYTFMGCAGCELHFMHPVPKREILETFYKNLTKDTYGPYFFDEKCVFTNYPKLKMWIAEHRYSNRAGLLGRLKKLTAVAAELISGRFVSYTLGIPLQEQSEAYMLDVGCGSGDWLIAMKSRGYSRLMGQDIAGPGLERLRRSKIAVFEGDLRDFKHPDNSFDLIRMEHVLEHLPDPIEYLSRIRSLLKPGGRLVINTPTVDSLTFQLAGRHWHALEPGFHLFFYTPSSLKCLGEKTNLRLVRWRYLPVFQQAVHSAQNMGRTLITKILAYPFLRFFARPVYGITMKVLRTGDFLTAEFIKV
ncbi:MAG: class I SAM-dependent methyltransferase [Deltaproteobacteria bacterium]|nr:class I SAM-dependent methyltransferase [Deltaproteobacteria bacterium]